MKINVKSIRYGDKITIEGMNNNKAMTFTECEYSYDNGLYESTRTCIGIREDDNDTKEVDESLYTLFGNNLNEKRDDIISFYKCNDDEHQQEVGRIQKFKDEEMEFFMKYHGLE